MGILSSMAVSVSSINKSADAVNVKKACSSISEASEICEKKNAMIMEHAKISAKEHEAAYAESIAPAQYDYQYDYGYGQNAGSVVWYSDSFDSSFKAYMDYRCITDTGSVQYRLQQQAYTDERGFRRIGNDYCVALGTGITSGCGERFLITLDSGSSFTAIVSDVKADIHTDSTNCYAPRGANAGNVVEFIIDTDNADGYMLSMGSAGCFADLSGNVLAIQSI